MRELHEIQAFLLDMDGTIYLSNQLLPGALAFLEKLKVQGKQFLFVTNNSSRNTQAYVTKLKTLGISVTPKEILTSGTATAAYLQTLNVERLYLIGTPDLEAEFQAEGFELTAEDPQCVVLGFDKTLTYQKLETACLLIRAGVPFVATHPDTTCPTDYGWIPDCGAMSALIQTATGVTPTVVGKPQTLLVEMALQRLGMPACEVAMVGDRLMTDIRMGANAGITTVLVLTGESQRHHLAESDVQPSYVLESIAELSQRIS